MTFTLSRSSSKNFAEIHAIGTIENDTADKFSRFVLQNKISSAVVYLDSTGGDLQGGVALGRKIRELGFATQVSEINGVGDKPYSEPTMVDAHCESSCAYSFLGGVVRTVLPNVYSGPQNRLGFHQFRTNLAVGFGPSSSLDTLSVSRAQMYSSKLGEYIFEMDANPSILTLADAAPLSLTGEDVVSFPDMSILRKYRVITDDTMPKFTLVAGDKSLSLVSFSTSQYKIFRQITISCTIRNNAPYLTLSYTAASKNIGILNSEGYFSPEDLISEEYAPASNIIDIGWNGGFSLQSKKISYAQNGQTNREGISGVVGVEKGERYKITWRMVLSWAEWEKISENDSFALIGDAFGLFDGEVYMEVSVDRTFRQKISALRKGCIPAPDKFTPIRSYR